MASEIQPTTPGESPYLEFLWVDGKSAYQVMARTIIEKLQSQTREINGVKFKYLKFNRSDDFRIAGELFTLIGNRATTRIASHGTIVNKTSLRKIFECYNEYLRARSEHYCRVKFGTTAAPSPIDITIRLSALGLSASAGSAPEIPLNRSFHPCRACYKYGSARSLDQIALEAKASHADLCPRFKLELTRE